MPNAPFVALVAAFLGIAARAYPVPIPRVTDPRLRLDLIASDPDIVTPVGLAIDPTGRLFVLESHTHSPPRNYPGPRSDRIKILSPPDANTARSRVLGVFADGIEDGMNLAFSPAGDLYVVTSTAVLRLSDRDNDGAAEARTTILELLTPQRPYEHAALLGLTFAPDGHLYVSRGNVGSVRYTIKSSADGSSVSGYGDGGNIVRCKPDGSALEEVATGFWNPFGLAFDRTGRLLCVDNDPDARGPNRLVHVVPGGDYGYRSLYGGGGNHPFQSWNGELPGTLPFAAGLGEAPCGVADVSATAFPDDYSDTVLCTVWGEHNVTRAKLKPKGASVSADTSLLVEGGQDFRPVAIATGPDGALYFTDWVKRDYPNHGHGRVWRLSAREGAAAAKPAPARPVPSPPPKSRDELLVALADPDPFVRSDAVARLAAPQHRDAVLASTLDARADVRLGALLALRRARAWNVDDVYLRPLLTDPDPRVRQMALVFVAEGTKTSLRNDLGSAIAAPGTSATLFETYLAAVECLSPDFVRALREGKEPHANKLPRKLDPAVVESIVRDDKHPPTLRALALTRLQRPDEERNLKVLGELLRAPEPPLALEAARTLAGATSADAMNLLRTTATDDRLSPDLRAEAILLLSSQPPAEAAGLLLPLLDNPHPAVRLEVIRALQGATTDDRVSRALRDRLDGIQKHGADHHPRVTEQLRFALHGPAGNPNRPTTLDAWQSAVSTGGDPASGRRLFSSPRAGCTRCHTLHNRGGRLGPDLSTIGTARDRNKLLHAILRPSDEYSIDYQAWLIKTTDGQTHLGLQLDLKDHGDIELFTTEARTVHFAGKDITAYGATKQSLMPDGLEAGMSVGDLRDLLAYLESLKP